MKPHLLLLLLAVVTPAASARETDLSGGCDLAVAGANDKRDFLAFDAELRAALSKRDTAAMALLVSFPLHVNHADGSRTSLENPAALQASFSKVFPKSVRSAILRHGPETVFCNDQGIMYGDGQVWVSVSGEGREQRYRVGTINLGAIDSTKTSGNPQLRFVCDAAKHRIVIDSDKRGTVRYRAWVKPQRLDEKPDVEVRAGTTGIEGTGSCAHFVWSFRMGATEIMLSELGCTDGSEPTDATGMLEVREGSETPQEWWCY